MIIIGFVLSVAGVATANPVLCGIGLGLGLLGAFLLFLWLVFCAADAGCRALQSMIQLVELLLWLIAIAALLGLVTGNFPCVGFLLGQGVAIGILVARMYSVFVTRPCQWQPGFFRRG